MNHLLHKKSILKKMHQVSGLTLASRLLGVVREILMSRFLGPGIVSDAFITAFKIPNSMRKVFAEGALSAALIPTFVRVMKKEGQTEVNRLMSLAFLVFEGILIALCLLIFWKADAVIRLIAPGWHGVPCHEVNFASWSEVSYSAVIQNVWSFCTTAWGEYGNQQARYAVSFLRVLISFIVFLSSSALLAAALQAVNHFIVAAISPVILNLFFIGGLLITAWLNASLEVLCYGILLGGLVQFLLHFMMYIRLGFSFEMIDRQALKHFKEALKKFLPCFISMSVEEIKLFIATTLASYLPAGAISLVYYANRFQGLPLGVFGVTISTILLPHFSRVGTYAPRRLSFYLLESAKLILFIALPLALLMSFLAGKIFSTLFLSEKFTLIHVAEAKNILIAYLLGLFFVSLNKILLNTYYALHDTRLPLFISCCSVVIYYLLCKVTLPFFGTVGLALNSTLSEALRSLLFVIGLALKHRFRIYWYNFFVTTIKYSGVVALAGVSFAAMYYIIIACLRALASTRLAHFFIDGLGFWTWVAPLALLGGFIVVKLRSMTNIRLYFLD